jgi:Acyl-CoA dehydrogenase, C-terminal domain
MEQADLELFAAGIRDVTASRHGAALDAALREMGWLDALEEDRSAAVSVFFGCQGETNTTSSVLERVLVHALGLGAGSRSKPTDVDGDLGVVLPALRTTDAPGRLAGGRCEVRGLALAGLAERGRALVVAADADGEGSGESGAGRSRAVVTPVGALELRAVGGIDPSLALVEVRGEVELSEGTTETLGPAAWDDAVALGQLALGHELVGAARAMLDLARRHALDRVQFGRPIATFQALRHRLADSFVAAESAASLLDAAWEDPIAYGAMAKGYAGRTARLTGRHCQQVLAGIGFTTEHPLHHFVRRVIVLDQLFGASTVLTRRLGAAVLAGGQLPREFPL